MKLKIKTNIIQLIMAVVLAVAGLVLLFLGFYAVPVGQIEPSVLTAFGEVSTFSASLMGIDYTYKYKVAKIQTETKEETDETDKSIDSSL